MLKTINNKIWCFTMLSCSKYNKIVITKSIECTPKVVIQKLYDQKIFTQPSCSIKKKKNNIKMVQLYEYILIFNIYTYFYG